MAVLLSRYAKFSEKLTFFTPWRFCVCTKWMVHYQIPEHLSTESQHLYFCDRCETCPSIFQPYHKLVLELVILFFKWHWKKYRFWHHNSKNLRIQVLSPRFVARTQNFLLFQSRFSDVFRGYRRGPLAGDGLNKL